MKRPFLLLLFVIACLLYVYSSDAQTVNYYGQYFKLDTLYPATGTTGLNFPWELTYGPDDSLWVTEAHGYRVRKINPVDIGSRIILDLSNSHPSFNETGNTWPQGGMMGLAIHPDFYNGKPYVYLACVYQLVGSCGTGWPANGGNPCYFNTNIVRYEYSFVTGNLINPLVIITGLPGSNDHNSGRMTIDPVDKKLFYTIGDMGAGQFNNTSRTHNGQDTTIYEGKVFRFNTEPDPAQSGGNEWIPDDNPFPAGAAATAKNAVYSYGHRNAQGLMWGRVAGTWRLYSAEHGDKSDDEINIIVPRGNYGWPKVAGLSTDNNYTTHDAYTNNDKLAGQFIGYEDTFYTNNTARGLLMVEPMKPLFDRPASDIKADGSNIFTWGTIAPSSLDFYGTYSNTIPGWDNSLLLSSLKYGLYRLNLSTSGTTILGDTIPYLHGNRVRDIAVNPHGDTLYLAIDKSGQTSGPTGGFNGGGVATQNAGFILRMVYLMPVLNTKEKHGLPPASRTYVKIYPNPATKVLYIDSKRGTSKPLRVQLIDRSGKVVLDNTSTKDYFIIGLEGIHPGMYIFRLYNGNGIVITTEKLVVQ
jgi:PQQ-dependent dehydrogenase (s-GDH family)